jgi:glycyl-tRNA synthetase beta chain
VKDLVFEIGTEEMPASAVERGIEELYEESKSLLEKEHLPFGKIEVYGSPRRLALYVHNLSERQEDRKVEVKGPPASKALDEQGRYTEAALGFARSQGVKPEELIVREGEKGKYVYAVKKIKGKESKEVLARILPELVSKIHFEKSMRWQGNLRFIRPIRWLLALFGEEVIPFELNGLKSSNITFGHRFLSPGAIVLKNASEYLEKLREGKVLVDQNERKEKILKETKKVLKDGGSAIIHPHVLNEVLHLVEYPTAIKCHFPDKFLALPKEVVINVLEYHQRYFPVEKNDTLLSTFVVIQNGDPSYSELIGRGNERVVKARLEDAKFFYEEDKKKHLEKRVEELKGVIFHRKLGTLWDKTERLLRLCDFIKEEATLSVETFESLKRAAYLCKADLLTEMVNEFPELQGVMGREYALHFGENEEVAKAIYEHYLPRFPGDSLPKSLAGKILSVLDKVDTICGYFLAGEIPSGSEDPYSLRRQGQAVTAVLLEEKLNLSLEKLLSIACEGYNFPRLRSVKETIPLLKDFFEGRFFLTLERLGFKPFLARLFLTQFFHFPVEALKKLEVLSEVYETPLWEDLLTAYTRPKNLSQKDLGVEVKEEFLVEETEKELYQEALSVSEKIEKLFNKSDFQKSLEVLASLRKIVDRFFDEVLVMAEEKDLRENRLKLLNFLVSIFERYADFSLIKE